MVDGKLKAPTKKYLVGELVQFVEHKWQVLDSSTVSVSEVDTRPPSAVNELDGDSS